jgi:hypothetical protein
MNIVQLFFCDIDVHDVLSLEYYKSFIQSYV